MAETPLDGQPSEPDSTEEWRRMLTGVDRQLPLLRRAWRTVPSGPRCKLCAAPFHGPGKVLTKVFQHGQSQQNPLLCSFCFAKLRDHVGGADIELSVLFADVRGSTSLAERLGAATFRAHLQQLYRFAHHAVESRDGVIDKFLGDGVMALFIPVWTGADHADRAIQSAIDLIQAVEASELRAAGVRVGAGVHTGPAFVGVIGSGERLDFTALGDTVNVAARLGGDADAGELLVSAEAWDARREDRVPADRRSMTVRGRAEPLEVISIRFGEPTTAAA